MDDELKQYLLNDIAVLKIRIAQADKANRSIIIGFCLAVFLACSIFAGTAWMLAYEHRMQMQALFSAGFSKEVVTEHVYQNDVKGPAVLNNRSNHNQTSIKDD